ncbi:hypothetical protein GALL_531760 [mine drainage metagenome]|uniref:Uncharacterized protein n=1 Tax=mine drainage metagenome TaxID=410659 RepID=A0A1J5PJ11_9ZZZZ
MKLVFAQESRAKSLESVLSTTKNGFPFTIVRSFGGSNVLRLSAAFCHLRVLRRLIRYLQGIPHGWLIPATAMISTYGTKAGEGGAALRVFFQEFPMIVLCKKRCDCKRSGALSRAIFGARSAPPIQTARCAASVRTEKVDNGKGKRGDPCYGPPTTRERLFFKETLPICFYKPRLRLSKQFCPRLRLGFRDGARPCQCESLLKNLATSSYGIFLQQSLMLQRMSSRNRKVKIFLVVP